MTFQNLRTFHYQLTTQKSYDVQDDEDDEDYRVYDNRRGYLSCPCDQTLWQ
jgi:hypothetical protein